MKTLKLDKYFATKGIDVRFNTLGYNDTLINSFVNDFREIVDKGKQCNSAHTKLECYSGIYTFEPRKKCTGFEKLSELDSKFRQNIQHFIVETQNTPLSLVENNKIDTTISYKDALKNELSIINDILVYYSGGLDSELVCKSLLESKKQFKIVVFQWTNNEGKIINEYDLDYAFKFCTNNNLNPIVKTINVENLWETDEFKELAKDIQLISPQLVTYAYMVQYMAKEYDNVTHLLAGEVRFRTNYLMDNGSFSNLVYLDKTTPEYNGLAYSYTVTSDQPETTRGVELQLLYDNGLFSTGDWFFLISQNVTFSSLTGQTVVTPPGTAGAGPYSGTWTTTPYFVNYEARTTSTYTAGPVNTPPTITVYPSWINLDQSALVGTSILQLQTADVDPLQGTISASVNFTVDVRVVGQTTPVSSSSFSFSYSIQNTYEPPPPPE